MKKLVVYAVTGWCFLLFILAAHAILASISQHFYGVVDLQLSNIIGWIGWAVLFLFLLPIDWILCRRIFHQLCRRWLGTSEV